LLEHPLLPALGAGGCRRWDAALEAEADWQAGALLVPRDAALAWIRVNGSLEEGALHFGVSIPLFQWRVNQTGVMRQLAASAFLPRRLRSA
jgi:Zn-dependent peptidase ImmA (M78 family)